MKKINEFFENQVFGVCQWWGEKLGIRSSSIRVWFIYTSFLTFGSPIIIYLVMAFFLKHKEYFKFGTRRPTVWD